MITTRLVLRVIACLLLALAAAGSLAVATLLDRAPASVSTPAPVYLPLVQQSSIPKLVFGLGPTASGARNSALALQSPLSLLTTWYKGWQNKNHPTSNAA